MDTAFHRPAKLLVYRERSASVKNLMEKLAKAELAFTPVVRDAVGVVQRREANGRMKEEEFKYASLESLHKSTKTALLTAGIVPMQEYCVSNEGVTLVTSLNYGDEFVSSTLPIRSFENQDQLVAHMSRMRRAGYAAVLCLAAEVEAIAAEPEAEAAAAPTINGLPAAQVWRMQNDLALRAIEKSSTVAEVEDTLRKIKAKIDNGDMDPHCLGRMEPACEKRLIELRTEAKASSNGRAAKQEATQ